jgi:t-SNARE complex subunit (syntaxin)
MYKGNLEEPLLATSYNTDAKLIEERNRDMREIESEIGAVREVMQDFSDIVAQGREQLDTVEVTVGKTDEDVEKGVEELVVANKFACSARWKMLIIAILCLLILAIIIAVIVIVVVVLTK